MKQFNLFELFIFSTEQHGKDREKIELRNYKEIQWGEYSKHPKLRE